MPFDAVSLGIGIAAGVVLTALAAWIAAARREAAAAAERADLGARLAMAERMEAEWREGAAERDRLLTALRGELSDAKSRQAEAAATLESERTAATEKIALLTEARTALADAFKALSADALARNNRSFLDLARETLATYQEQAKGDLDKRQTAIGELVAPVRQSIEKMDKELQELEKARVGAYAGLREQVASLIEMQNGLRAETGNLVRALRTPVARGRWGEIQLRRVVELAGMLDHCDFFEQASVDGGKLRPDLIVRLPGGKTIVVDAKTPLEGFLDAVQAGDDAGRRDGLARHARHVRDHMRQLGQKGYWDQFPDAPEFVVLFLPGENFFSAALEHDPALIEAGIDHRVILATPTTLIALLRAVAYGWRQERMAQNARVVSDLGAELYKRLSDLAGHVDKLGGQLGRAVDCYNKAVGTLESRVLVTARKFKDLGAAPDASDLSEVVPLEQTTRALQAAELRPAITDS